ncbi:MAG: hypothetical protein WC940_02340 [Candidatus Paceibacterota bacterium]|jgi:hypothetical protein
MQGLKEIASSNVRDANDNFQEGMNKFAEKMVRYFQEPKFNPNEFSIKELFQATVVDNPKNATIDFGSKNNKTPIVEAVAASVFPLITGSLINKYVMPAYEYSLEDVMSLVQESTTTCAPGTSDVIAGINSMPPLRKVNNGEKYAEGSFNEKNISVEIGKWGRIISLEMETIMSDKTGEITRRASTMGDQMGAFLHRYIVETITGQARNALEEATSTAFVYGGSNLTSVLYSNDHSTVDGQTNKNLSATSSIDTFESWNKAWELMSLQKDYTGEYIRVTPRVVMVNPLKAPRASQFVVDTQEPTTGNNGSNYYSKLGLKVFSSPYVSSTNTDWFIGDPRKQTILLWYKRPGVEFQGADSNSAFERDVIARFKPSLACGVGLMDYKYVVKCTA